MSVNYEEILSAALQLPPGTRAMLADNLLESLNSEDQKTIDSIWAEEAECRARAIDEGRTEIIPGDEVLAELGMRV